MNNVCISGKVHEIRARQGCTYATIMVHGYNSNEFLDVTFFKNQKTFFENNFKKGQWINITGHLRKSMYNGQSKLEIIADKIEFCGNKEYNQSSDQNQTNPDIEPLRPIDFEDIAAGIGCSQVDVDELQF